MSSGINRLIQAKEIKSQNANVEHTADADSHRPLVNKQKSLTNIQRPFDELAKSKTLTGKEISQAKHSATAHNSAIASEASVLKPEAYLKGYPNASFSTLVNDLATVASKPTRYANGLRAFVKELNEKVGQTKKVPEPPAFHSIWGLAEELVVSIPRWDILDLIRKFDDSASLAVSAKKKIDDRISSKG